MHLPRPRLALVAVALTALATVACAGTAEDGSAADAGNAAAAQTANPAYEAAARASSPKVETTTTPGEEVSSATSLLGFVPNRTVDEVASQLVDITRWREIKDGPDPIFSSARELRDDEASPRRTVAGKVTLASGDISLDVALTADARPDATRVVVTNTTGYRNFLLGRILDPGKLTMSFKLVPYEREGRGPRGVIVEATVRVKLESFEDRAGAISSAVTPIFSWLKS